MADDCYYKLLGEQFGPVSREFLEELVLSGQLGPTDVVRIGETGGWRPTSAVVKATAGAASQSHSHEQYTPAQTRGLFSAVNERAGQSQTDQLDEPSIDEFMDLSELEIVEDAPPPMTGSRTIPSPPPPANKATPPAAPQPKPAAANRTPDARPANGRPAEPVAADAWYCQMMGQELGPFTLAQLRSQLDAGELAPQAKVRRGKTGNWSPLSSHLTGPGAATPTGSTRAPAAQVAPAPIAPAPIAPAPIAPPAAWAAPAPVVVAAPVIVPVVAAPIAAPPGNVSGSSAASSAVDEDRIWYCYTNDKQYGPISLETLAKWAAEGRLKKDNHVKMGADGEWFRAGDIDELFNEDKKAAKQGMAEVRIQSTAEFAQEKSNMQTAAVPAAAATNPNQQQKFTPLVAKDFKLTNRHDKKPGLNIPKQYIYLGVLVAVGLAVYLPQLPFVKSIFGGSWDQKVLLTLRNHYINLKKFREKKDAAGWDKYAKSVEKEMKSLATTLTSRGGSAYPARQQMMYAARDHWPKMVTDSKEKAGESEEKFNKALSTASTAMRKKK